MINISPFNAVHSAGALSVILNIQREEFSIPITLEAQPDLLDVANFYQSGNGNFWVALDGENVVGTIALLDIGNETVALRKMFVDSRYRGREAGVAQDLLATALAWCADKRVRRICLGTTDKFTAAHRFYEKNGFASIEQDALPKSFPIMSVDTKFYCRTLR